MSEQRKDILAGLSGCEEFLDALAEAMAEADAKNSEVSVALVDIDSFGEINAQHGESAGDRVLEMTVQRLSELEVPGKCVYRHNFRTGGDEFVMILPDVEKEHAFLALEREREKYAEPQEISADGKKLTLQLSFSAAIATYPEDGPRPKDVLRKANDAVYRAKSSGRNRICLAREERMVTKTSHYTQGQLARLSQLAKREKVGEAVLLREALDELLREYGV